MPHASFFAKLGLFVVQDFFDAGLCAKVRAEMRAAPNNRATISRGSEILVDENARRTKWIKVSASTRLLVQDRLLAVMPNVASHFDLALTDCEYLQFLRYGTDDFFEPHTDNSDRDDAFDVVQARQVSVVLFLNGEMEKPEPDGYSGGALTLYGLIDKPGWETKGFSVVGEPGLLIAFRSDVHHEVTPVTHGERYTIVTWFS